jgi:hypothetical protein
MLLAVLVMSSIVLSGATAADDHGRDRKSYQKRDVGKSPGKSRGLLQRGRAGRQGGFSADGGFQRNSGRDNAKFDRGSGTRDGRGRVGRERDGFKRDALNRDGRDADTRNGRDGSERNGRRGRDVNGRDSGTKGRATRNAARNFDGKGRDGKGRDAKGRDAKGRDARDRGGRGDGRRQFGRSNDRGGQDRSGRTRMPLSRALAERSQRGRPSAARMRLFADHHRQFLSSRSRIPRRLLPGERGFTGVPAAGEQRFVKHEMVFQLRDGISQQALDAAARRLGLSAVSTETSDLTGGAILQFRVADQRSVPDVIKALEADNLGIAQPNYVYTAQQDFTTQQDLAARTEMGDPSQYVVQKLSLLDVHRVASGNNVLIAVIDSQVDIRHPDLMGAVVDSFDAVGSREGPDVHGTGMVGAIAAHRRLLGIAPNAKILAVRAFTANSSGSPEATTRSIIAGLDWAIKKGARIVNMSFAGPADPMMQLAMKKAHEQGVILIAAAGNMGAKSPPLYPAADPNVMAITATDENDKLFPQAVRGPHLAMAAPGVNIVVPAPSGAYQITTGTSVAAAHVSGVAALLLERHPEADAATIMEVLTSSAKRLSPKGRDDQFGWGLVDPYAALLELDERMASGKVASPAKPAIRRPGAMSSR